MNKFAIFTVLALAALAISVHSTPFPDDEDFNSVVSQDDDDEFFEAENEELSQAYLRTTDDKEAEALQPLELEVFTDFCIQSRDYIFADIKKETNNLSKGIFSLFFQTAEAVAKEAIQKQMEATEKLGDQLADPSKEIDEEQDEIIAAGQKEIQSTGTVNGLITAFRANVAAVSATVGQMVSDKFDYLMQQFNLNKVAEGVGIACSRVAEYEKDLEMKLEEYKEESLDDESREKFAKLELKQIPCATASKVIRLEGLCTLVRRGQEPLKKMVGYY